MREVAFSFILCMGKLTLDKVRCCPINTKLVWVLGLPVSPRLSCFPTLLSQVSGWSSQNRMATFFLRWGALGKADILVGSFPQFWCNTRYHTALDSPDNDISNLVGTPTVSFSCILFGWGLSRSPCSSGIASGELSLTCSYPSAWLVPWWGQQPLCSPFL